ncbi:uncharacterized protein [Watersipora subatra]|uniref:uncharacterized protein n=1 Tax=Watersipora subatra TaxID=2589382 RepID=UPI00355B9202
MEYPIDEQKKGLFVIIEQTSFNFRFDIANEKPVDWQYADELKYGSDTEALIETLGLHGDELVPPGRNLTGTSVHPEDSEKKKCFETFMEDVCSSERSDPKFIMLFLMSHGFENGIFMLASEGKQVNGQLVSDERCCSPSSGEQKPHTFTGECYARYIVKDIMEKVADRYKGIPKIYILQCCRGSKNKNLKVGEAPPEDYSGIELFINNQPDALVFWASTETYVSKVPTTGSFLIQSFCEAVKKLQENKMLYGKLLNGEMGKLERDNVSLVKKYLEDHREDVTGGWLMNVCQHTTALVTNHLLIDIILPKTEIGKVLAQSYGDTIAHYQNPQRISEVCKSLLQALEKRSDGLSQYVLDPCTSDIGLCWTVFMYMWFNIRVLKAESKYYFELETELRHKLNEIIENIRDKDPIYKQQPHISSSLARKVSFIKILHAQGK